MTNTGLERSPLFQYVEDYLRAINSRQTEACLKYFSEDCLVHDPFGYAEYRGRVNLRQHFTRLYDTWRYYMIRGDSFYLGDEQHLALRWSVSATAQNSKTAEFNGISIFRYEDEKIAQLDTYWNYRHVFHEIDQRL